MCAALMDVQAATTEALHAAVDSKLRKFGGLGAMPEATRVLVEAGMAEIDRRNREAS